jgi:hypothetical protein
MIVEWTRALFDATGFLPRGHCGPWTVPLELIYIISNGFIAQAYALVAVCLFLIGRKRSREIEYGWLLPWFSAVFAACALTHVCDIVVFWWPAYRLFTLISGIAAILSISTAMWTPSITKALLAMPSPTVFQQVNKELESALSLNEVAINELRGTITALRRQVDHLERMRQTGLWVAEQESALRELKKVLESPFAKEAHQ